jgi:hypothetical protein
MSSELQALPEGVVERLRTICAGLPQVTEEEAWLGVRWRVRQRTVVHVMSIDAERTTVLKGAFDVPEPYVAIALKATAEEWQALVAQGYPFAASTWGHNIIAMHVTDSTDWQEVAELVTESYCLLAPRGLAAQVRA